MISPLGNDYASVAASLRQGRSGVRAMPEWREHGLKSLVAGALVDIEGKRQAARLPKKILPGMSDGALFCALAAQDAVADAGLGDRELQNSRCACIIGSAVGSVDAIRKAAELYFSGRIRRMDPYTLLRGMSSSTSATVANLFRVRGPSYSISSACATSAHNIGHAGDLIRSGVVDRAIAGGGEDLSEVITASFQSLRLALSTRFNDRPTQASRPFDTQRDGFVISGGAGIVILEELEAARSRGANIRGELAGYAATSDGHDLVLPEPTGEQAAACIQLALSRSALDPSTVDYVNCHATSTAYGDAAEARALEQVFGPKPPPFSSTKSMTGHGLGAAGGLELIYCLAMIEHGFIAPSINVETPDPAVEGLPLVTETRDATLDTVVSNNFGFGGTNASLVLRRFDG
ncbi:MAG: beta-ketoacyl-[acyl-carrier-protein] synthase family protein [Acidobacteria bacterium]|nr:beta-ketoacyl-[acyl-carrier-protein] synthase family protein [Acidobacteriota bacterium]